ncbi:MAG: DUF4136 domain-containing protein [Planctomycetota bacterium]
MRVLGYLLVLFVVALAVGCIEVQYDYDPDVNFAALKTFDWMPIEAKPTISELALDRIKKSITSQLEAKGLKMASQKPDFHIVAHVSKEEKIDITSFGYDYAPARRYWRGAYPGDWRGGYPGDIRTTYYEEGTLILDFVDAKTKKLLWRATAKKELDPGTKTPEEAQKSTDEVVQKILEHFPPRQPATKGGG